MVKINLHVLTSFYFLFFSRNSAIIKLERRIK
nr:MAG TPA: hypothetical protein [Caudoviricetes sp.]